MNGLGITGLAALVLLSQPPMQAQRRATVPTSQTQQEQKDVEFLKLYRGIRDLETEVHKNLARVMDRNIGERKVYGSKGSWGLMVGQPPEAVGNIVEQKYYNGLTKLASRYGKTVWEGASIFTSGNSIIASRPWNESGYLIFDEFSMIFRPSSRDFRSYIYSKFTAHQDKDGKITVTKYEDVVNGIIPVFAKGDFQEIYEKIQEYDSGKRDALLQGYGSISNKVEFFNRMLEDIAVMITERIIEDGLDQSALLPKSMFELDIYAKSKRIIIGSHNPGYYGPMDLSIGPSGDVSYRFQWVNPLPNPDYLNKPIYQSLRIKFPLK